MSRVLLCGLCPLPFENTPKSFGPGIRTWQFAASLAAAGHDVHLVAMRIPGSYSPTADFEQDRHEIRDGVAIERLVDREFFEVAEITRRVEAIAPEVLVGATLYGSHMLARTQPNLPFWADQFGHVMAEAQAKAFLEQANWPIAHFWHLLEPILRTADHFSTVSERQRWAALGELGVVGRLSAETCGHEFFSVIPCALVPTADTPRPARTLRGSSLPADAFVVLWSGGYNVWSDVETLFHALERVMAEEPRLFFLSTGGEIGGHDERTYAHFLDLVAGSRWRERFLLKGWVQAEEVPLFQAEADLGVLTEKVMAEGQLGHKNRVVQWLGAGLPVAYNRVGDLGDLLVQEQIGLVFEVGDAEGLAQAIRWAMANPAALAEMASRGQNHARSALSFSQTTRELCAWVANPRHAPDAALRGQIQTPADYRIAPPAPPPVSEPLEPTPPAAEPAPPEPGSAIPAPPVDPAPPAGEAPAQPLPADPTPPPRPRSLPYRVLRFFYRKLRALLGRA